MANDPQTIVEEDTSSSKKSRDTSILDNSDDKIDNENQTQPKEKLKQHMKTSMSLSNYIEAEN